MKRNKIIFYIATGLLSALVLYSAGMYFFNHEEVAQMFSNFGYPTYIIYPYAVAKLLGLFAIWNPNFKVIKEWAYAGFFFAFVLAFFCTLYDRRWRPSWSFSCFYPFNSILYFQ